ncbi:hypothetical protein [Gemmatimonas groenlandica]|uniref:Uncharacterized protein n=1 Tax=Gemmatimonas groenlandica TaxID=2732249 RepID=A0A6M4ILA7_9BACT|nr:hypothetical protein [Gemmatimonas groenlandica]QJR34658.1 hypothetical protein HKW67_03560 [Gemmatimonas groenlandica]
MSTVPSLPYGPQTPAVRGFLVRLAGLGAADRAGVVARYATIAVTTEYEAADARLGEVITRSGREDARDALSGPLLQLVKRPVQDAAAGEDIELEPIAEPALAALLALMTRDLLDETTVRLLTEAFSNTIPLG